MACWTWAIGIAPIGRSAATRAARETAPRRGAVQSLLGQEVGEQRDRGRVAAQVFGTDLVERIGRAVVDVEVVAPVGLEIERGRAGGNDRCDVGPVGVRLEAPDAELREGRKE